MGVAGARSVMLVRARAETLTQRRRQSALMPTSVPKFERACEFNCDCTLEKWT